jgi:hypothetical protein
MKYLRQHLLDEKNREIDTLTEADEQHITVRADGKEIVTVKHEHGKISVSVAGGSPVYLPEGPTSMVDSGPGLEKNRGHLKPLEGTE